MFYRVEGYFISDKKGYSLMSYFYSFLFFQIYAVSITIRIVVSSFAYRVYNLLCSLFHSSNFLSMYGLQLGFLLLACLWRFDFPPMLVLVIAILNDGNRTALYMYKRRDC